MDLISQFDMFPHIIDSTMLSTLRSCPQKFYYKYIFHYNSSDISVDLHAGKCLATAVEVARKQFFNGKSVQECVDAAVWALHEAWGEHTLFADETKNLMRMDSAIRYYLQQFPLDDTDYVTHVIDGKPCIEMAFNVPIDLSTPDGQQIQFVGTTDWICKHAGGLWMLDEKTTGSSLSYNWGDQWVRRGQFIGYKYGLEKQYGIELDGAIVSGIAIQKTQFGHKLKLLHIAPYLVEQWIDDTINTLKSAMQQYESGQWLKSFGEHCHSYGRSCEYLQACNSPEPLSVLAPFKKIKWDPINRQQVNV